MPNDADIPRAIGAIERRQGKWEQSTRSYRRAVSLNPRDAVLIRNLALNFVATRDYPTAMKLFDRAVALAPHDFEMNSLRAWVDVYWKGDFTRFDELLATAAGGADVSPVAALARFNVQFFQRRFEEALAALAKTPFENMRGATSAPLPKSFLAAQVYRAMGNAEQARAAFEQALTVAERAVWESPDEPARHMVLALSYAGLGRREDALREGNRAVEILPESKDALNGPIFKVSLARIHAILGNHEEAIALLEHSLETIGGVTVNELRFDPTWDTLRAEPRFQKFVAKNAAQN